MLRAAIYRNNDYTHIMKDFESSRFKREYGVFTQNMYCDSLPTLGLVVVVIVQRVSARYL